MEEYFSKLYKLDPLFRSLVHAKLGIPPETPEESGIDLGSLTLDDEMEILREYAITLYKEHKTLKGFFMESLRLSSKSTGLKNQQGSSDGS